MITSTGRNQFQYLFQVAPIVLLGGLASQLPGGQLSVFSLLQSVGPVTAPGVGNTLDGFVQFVPLPGGTLVDNDIGRYPFASQATAANAIVTQPLIISFKMIVPASAPGGFQAKQAMMISFQQSIQQHNQLGGLYACATPGGFWDSCVMRTIADVGPPAGFEENQAQVEWRIDFEQPNIVTSQQAAQQYNTLLSKINNGTMLTPNGSGVIATSGPQATSGNPSSGVAPSVSPPVQSLGLGSSEAGYYQTGIANSSTGVVTPNAAVF